MRREGGIEALLERGDAHLFRHRDDVVDAAFGGGAEGADV